MMNVQEQWDAWRAMAEIPSDFRRDYIEWTEAFTDESNDPDKAFACWRQIPADERKDMLMQALDNKIVVTGIRSQFELGVFFALYQFLHHRRCFVTSPLPTAIATVREVLKKVSSLGNINLKAAGPIFMAPNVYLADCRTSDIVFADYYQLLAALHKHHDDFVKTVQSLFVMEADISLYNNRVIIFERGTARAAGAVYKSTGSLSPEWEKANEALDIPRELAKIEGLVFAGSLSRTDKYTASELTELTTGLINGKIKAGAQCRFSAFTYRRNTERCSALVNDVMRCQGNALVVCYTDSLIRELQEEFRKSGQDCTITARSVDLPTFFSLSQDSDKKKVLILRGLPSPMILVNGTMSKGAVFVGEHFLGLNMHQKIFTVGEQLFEMTQPPRLYFTLEDALFSFYESEAGFSKLFDFIDFTEKYDPWRQVRRVLAKSMIEKLHKIRAKSFDENTPLFTTTLNSSKVQTMVKESKQVASKLDAPCFCGSGKPFRECHGKKLV